ncbi:hypothetical protein TNCV_2742531 [Trichonephila clavipes]|nr:hypothetical protein TNCV_2742531 [Trichonephila clavipes]
MNYRNLSLVQSLDHHLKNLTKIPADNLLGRLHLKNHELVHHCSQMNKNENPRKPIKMLAENATSVLKLFAFPAKILVLEPVLPCTLEEWN